MSKRPALHPRTTMREPIVDKGEATVTFMSSSLGGGMRLWFGLFCLAPVIASLDEPAEIDALRLVIAAVFGLVGVLMAGPFARAIGTSVTWNRDDRTLEWSEQRAEGIGAVRLSRRLVGSPSPDLAPASDPAAAEPSGAEPSAAEPSAAEPSAAEQLAPPGVSLEDLPGQLELQVVADSEALRCVRTRIDRALQGARTPTVSRSELEAGLDLDALESLGTIDDNVTEPFGVALAAAMARLMDVPLIVSDCGTPERSPDATDRLADDPDVEPAELLAEPSAAWSRVWTPSELSTPLVERFGRTLPFPPRDDGEDGDDGRAVDASVRSIMPTVGGVTLLIWYGLLSFVADGPWLLWLGLGWLVAGIAGSALGATRVSLLDGGHLELRRFRRRRLPVRRIVDVVSRPGDQSEVIVLTDSGPLNAVIPGDAKALEELRVCLWGGLAAIARRALEADAPRAGHPVPLSWLPAPSTAFAVADADLWRCSLNGRTLRLGDVALELDRPFRAFLSWAPDRAGQPILHLECRQRSGGQWARVGVRARTDALACEAAAVQALPELANPFPFLQSATMESLLALLRDAQHAHGDERWI